MIAAAVVRNAVVLKLAVVNASNAVIHAAINVAVIMVDMVTDMDMAMDTLTDLDLEDTEDMVIQVSSNI